MRMRAIAMAVAFLLAAPSLGRAAPGDLDPAFGDDGKATAEFGAGSGGNDAVRQRDGKIVVAGRVEGMVAVMRFRANGSVDPAFGDHGVALIPLGHRSDEANGVAIQPNGRIVVVGTDGRERFVVARLTVRGDLDRSFGGDGVVRTRPEDRFRAASDLAIQPDGRIVVVGTAGTDMHAKWGIARFRPTGASTVPSARTASSSRRSSGASPSGRTCRTTAGSW